MAQNEMIQLQPVFKDYIWGGTKIRDFFRKNTGNLDRIAESWEFSSHVEGQSRIASGEYAGKTLSEFFAAVGWSKVGGFGRENRNLPCMVKFIDACENLSIQVHPTDNYAIRHERDNGKNEMWYIMSAEEGAFIYVGFNKNTSRKEVLRRIQDHSIEEILNKVPVRKGDSFFIPAGTVHAIGAGCFICEIQQTSNVTYRLYDYDRRDRDWRLRPLQIKKALEVLDYHHLQVLQDEQSGLYHIGSASSKMLARTNWFTVTKYDVDGDLQISVMRSPYSLYKAFVVVDGEGDVVMPNGPQHIKAGYTWLLKQQAPLRISGHCSVLIINL